MPAVVAIAWLDSASHPFLMRCALRATLYLGGKCCYRSRASGVLGRGGPRGS
jgi:hypothetical protein